MCFEKLIMYMDNALNNHRNVLIVSVFFLLLSLSLQSYIWVFGGFNGLDYYAYEYTAKATIENDYNWLFLHPANNLVNPHSPVIIYTLISLYTIAGSWLFAWIALLFINAFIAIYFIYKLGLNITKNNLIASYITLLFVTTRTDGGYHGILFPGAGVIGLTFIIVTMYFLTSENPRYYLAGLSTIIVMISHPYAGLSIFLFLILFMFTRLLNKDKIVFLKRYSLVILSTIPGILYYYYIYISFKIGGLDFSRGTESIMSTSLKYFNFMELPSLYGFLHLTFAFIGILFILGKNKSLGNFLKNHKISSLFIWSILLLAYSQSFFFINTLANYRFLLFPIIALVVFGGIGLDIFFKKMLKSDISKMLFYFSFFVFIFVTPIFYNLFAMDPVINENQRDVLNHIKEHTNENDVIFTLGSSSIYFTDITERKIGASALSSPDFDRIESLFLSLELDQAKQELINNDIVYLYLDGEVGDYFKNVQGAEIIYEKDSYYFFGIE